MAASLTIFAGEDFAVPSDLGLGFFGEGGFDSPVVVGEFNGRTFITDASGSTQNFEANNNKFTSTSGVIHGQTGSGILLTALPNSFATVNMRFENTAAVRTLNPKLYIFDGSFGPSGANINIPPDGLTFFTAELRKVDEIQTANGLGDSTWLDTSGLTFLSLIDAPGTLGLRPGGSFTIDTRHDWYIAMSCSPITLGDKIFGLYFEVEFL